MFPNPVVLIFSEGRCLPEDVAKGIIKANSNTDYKIVDLDLKNQNKTIGLTMNISNKYFSTELLLVPFTEDVSMVPLKLVQSAEAMLVYFDSKDRKFTNRISNYTNFLRSNNIELGVLICDSLHNDSKDGITYTELKSEGRVLDIVELAETCTNDGEAEGYSEICEILNNFIWSNVKKNETTTLPISQQPSENNANSYDHVIENEFKMFEQLLSDVMCFRNSSEMLPREERMIYAEQFAKKFEPLLEDLCSDEES